ncbi:antitoxin [candidate division WOR-1 bacterium RIFOXYA12_FULL_43_27]|uniref:Antitoxin n=1 Tax=candidate division WOR-1 bacterium RIFOXYC2_FULL_46_14 TaxID=1802587 RepID=A0A1F4U542_UNCSA|nr:MAG: antitoxin [candidate division WOR-1 bacterium RIFOXYA12_FULL_43_27]OGC20669.1 MAG: antitoxin [candidate division WOR-1 bacterium RIFOXYB2_FULL_46_45]OGC31594.1 MAG: antitoxin [candidate division WOR-1 bacterium RIFOXYA2_FULL_46_56]OGC39999.1 MAG: antitoxin [candidate division WOR-1 bacterium RIFOXYC2_FULL_46_14]
MNYISTKEAKNKLPFLLKEISYSHEPVIITDKNTSGVLLSEDDWEAIQETLYLLAIPKMRESIKIGLKTPISRCSKKIKW